MITQRYNIANMLKLSLSILYHPTAIPDSRGVAEYYMKHSSAQTNQYILQNGDHKLFNISRQPSLKTAYIESNKAQSTEKNTKQYAK